MNIVLAPAPPGRTRLPTVQKNAVPVEWTEKVLAYWATPRAKVLSASRILTRRGSSTLPNQLRFEMEYMKAFPEDSDRPIRLNPEWCEWMQGMPRGWTDVRSAEVGNPI